MVMGACLVEHCPRLKERGWGEMAWAHHAKKVCRHRAKWTGSSIWWWQRVDVEDWDSQATQCQPQYQLWPWLITVGFGWMGWNTTMADLHTDTSSGLLWNDNHVQQRAEHFIEPNASWFHRLSLLQPQIKILSLLGMKTCKLTPF